MCHDNREIEKKFLVAGKTLQETKELIEAIVKECSSDSGRSKDCYWHPKAGMKADFVRLRYMPDGTGQMTVKYSDKGSNLDRIEIDVEVADPHQALSFLAQIHGEPAYNITKNFHSFWVDEEKSTNISTYQIEGDSRVFLEVESRDLNQLTHFESLLGTAVVLEHEERSLYQIFIKQKGDKNESRKRIRRQDQDKQT